MKKLFYSLMVAAMTLSACSDSSDEPVETPPSQDDKPQWHLVWQEDFENAALDESVWSRTDRGTPDWQNTQSKDDRCYGMRDGNIILKGIVNPDLSTDPSPYLTGGIWTKGKKAFGRGRMQVRARLGKGAKGAWPAIWMMPFESTAQWPDCGEIDIMERLNHDNSVYQTLHSRYTSTLGIKNPPNSKVTYLNPEEFHTFEVQVWSDMVVFAIDDNVTLRYPRLDGKPDQFPFDQRWYLIIDMQLGGSWVGEVDPAQLPVEMEVDWVRFYEYY